MSLAETTVAVLMVCVGAFLLSLIVGLCKDTFFSTDKKSGTRIIKKGKLPKEEVECPCCHSIIEYTKRNVWYGGKSIDGKMLRYYVDCPVCHENILVREEKGGEE